VAVGTPSGLAFTGSRSDSLATIAGGLILTGFGLVWSTRSQPRRRRSSQDRRAE
jgi:hypothetical protein